MTRLSIAAIFAALISFAVPNHGSAQQTVFLDFSGTDGAIPYSGADMTTIMGIMGSHYAAFDVTFTLSAPGVGPFSKR